ncbi:MAG: cytochrome c nitrite reductase small subunit [Thermogutta sp.]
MNGTLRTVVGYVCKVGSATASLAWFPFPLRWLIFAALGACLGLGALTVHVSRAPSYLSDEPEVCVNCHVMRPEYVSWRHSSHAEVANCNDCHVPHDSFLAHWLFKARDGLWHATVFTMRWEPQVIRLSDRAVPVVEANCRRCHEHLVGFTALREHERDDLRCWDCHGQVPHGETRGLASSPGYLDPSLPPLGARSKGALIGGRPPR